MPTYPSWSYFPRNERPPLWAQDLVDVTAAVAADISTESVPDPSGDHDRKSDAVLSRLRLGLESLGYAVEKGKKRADKITGPVLFGNDGQIEVAYDIDAFHDELGVAVEVEAGRGAANGADYEISSAHLFLSMWTTSRFSCQSPIGPE